MEREIKRRTRLVLSRGRRNREKAQNRQRERK